MTSTTTAQTSSQEKPEPFPWFLPMGLALVFIGLGVVWALAEANNPPSYTP